MGTVATTQPSSLSSKGQAVIPEEIRRRLGLEEGTRVVVVGDRDVVILNRIPPPALGELEDLVRRARSAAKEAALKPAEVERAIAEVRGSR